MKIRPVVAETFHAE